MVFQVQAGTAPMKGTLRPLLVALCCSVINIACGSNDIRKGNVALELGDYSLAIKFFSHCLEHDPADFEARVGIGKAYLQKASDNQNDRVSWREALMHLEAAHTVQGNPEINKLLGQVWAERGSSLLYVKDTIQALEALSRAIAVDQRNHEALNLAGIIYYKTGRPEKARLLFERAVSIDTANTSSIFNLGMLYWEERNIKKARNLWLRALTDAPHDEELLYWFAAAEKSLRDSAQPGAGSTAGDSTR
jgi:Flp pilus assembly protein TadD